MQRDVLFIKAPSRKVKMVQLSSLTIALSVSVAAGFSPSTLPSSRKNDSSTSALNAIGVLARKAREASVRDFCVAGLSPDIMEKVNEMKAGLEKEGNNKEAPGPIQCCLTKRKGTISLIAEYKRKFAVETGFADKDAGGIFEPAVMSPVFREFGASGVAVMADERMGGCTYIDLSEIAKEQMSAKGDMPGPVGVISSDLIVDEVQIAQSAAAGAGAVVVTLGVVGEEKTDLFIKCANALNLETIVAVSNKDEAQKAVDLGGRILYITGIDDVDSKWDAVKDLTVPEGAQVCTIANILANNNKALEEVEEAWVCRDKGFNAVWVSDALYKSGNDPSEHAGAIMKAMTAKSSVKWASAKAMGGKGEGAREYLGDILM